MSIVRDLAYTTAACLIWPLWTGYLLKTGKWRTDWSGRFGYVALPEPTKPRVVIHGVSVGEINATRTLVRQFESELADQAELIITTTTNTGMARATQNFAEHHAVLRYPLDLSSAVNRFLDRVQPAVVVLMELELWPNFIEACEHRNIPVLVINGRLSARSFKRYYAMRTMFRSTFAAVSQVGAQTKVDAERFVAMGVEPTRVQVTGNMKWDTATMQMPREDAKRLAEQLGINRQCPLVVCGSTGPGEERMIIEALQPLLVRAHQPIQLLFAPRKPERFDQVAETLQNISTQTGFAGCRMTRRSQPGASDPQANIFLLDTLGELRAAYALADVVIVGRSFCDLYGSDVIEPIALGKPTIVGPNTSDFQQIVETFVAADGLIQLPDIDTLPQHVERLLDPSQGCELGERGRAVIEDQRGATDCHIRMIGQTLRAANAPWQAS